MSESAVVGNGDLQKALDAVGFDLEKELQNMTVESNGLDLPRVRIEHKDNGKHRMYIHMGESYLDEESEEIALKGNRLEAVCFAEQQIRAFWKENESVPACSAINSRPITDEPIYETCNGCPEAVIGSGRCKPKARIMLLTNINGEIKPVIFNLSPTSLKWWSQHKKKLQRSNLPIVACNTVFELEDIKKNGYRWAEVRVSVDGIASRDMLVVAKQARTELEKLTQKVSDQDFSDPGDKMPF